MKYPFITFSEFVKKEYLNETYRLHVRVMRESQVSTPWCEGAIYITDGKWEVALVGPDGRIFTDKRFVNKRVIVTTNKTVSSGTCEALACECMMKIKFKDIMAEDKRHITKCSYDTEETCEEAGGYWERYATCAAIGCPEPDPPQCICPLT